MNHILYNQINVNKVYSVICNQSDNTAGKIVSPYGNLLQGTSSKMPLFTKFKKSLCTAFNNCAASSELISW